MVIHTKGKKSSCDPNTYKPGKKKTCKFDPEVKGQSRISITNVSDTSSHGDTSMWLK